MTDLDIVNGWTAAGTFLFVLLASNMPAGPAPEPLPDFIVALGSVLALYNVWVDAIWDLSAGTERTAR